MVWAMDQDRLSYGW